MTTFILAAALMAGTSAVHEPQLWPDTAVVLDDVTVTDRRQLDFQMHSSQSSVQISHDYMERNYSGSLMQTLQDIPGVKAMSIGSGQSKPMIRGLGFNRMAVSEDGIKHEGQQWGDDHGLEIDQFAVERAEIIKGPSALLYGSDAIGGVLNLYSRHIPDCGFEGAVQIIGRSVNDQTGISARIGGLKGKMFYNANMTWLDYSDYRIPSDSIQYYSYYIKLKDRRLRNTAGRERDGSVMLGYAGYRFHTDLRVSDSYSRSGFFANAHGLEVRLSDIDYDRSARDIDLPYQWVNHLKVLSHTSWQMDMFTLEASLAYQNNLREELSEPVSHGYMPKPDGTLERRFLKDTYTANISLNILSVECHELRIGANAEYQKNRQSGWGFIIPSFETLQEGLYITDSYAVHDGLKLNAGVRMDHAMTHIHSYSDWFKTPQEEGDSIYVERSSELRRPFNSITWSAGINRRFARWLIKANAGKSYRIPIPKELGADGINYHIFRYERGNPSLDPEESYQLDLGITYESDRLTLQFDPYVNYFPNYIYLNPTATYVEGLQLYHYSQAKVFRWGLEAQMTLNLSTHWEAEVSAEYLYARQLSGPKRGYTLPFSTPWSAQAGLCYTFKGGFTGLNAHMVGDMNEIVPPEKTTPGHWTLNLQAGKQLKAGKNTVKVLFQANNLLNVRYYDHTSYYRLIDVPEPGRNLTLMIALDF